MKRSVLTLASISTLALSLAACGGGGSGGTGVNPQPPTPGQTTSPTSKASASVKVSFVVPVATGHTNPSSSKRQTKSLSSRKPLYISPDTAGFFFFMDGHAIFGTPSSGSTPNTAASLTPNTYTSSASIPGGGTATYTVTQQTANNGTGCTVTTCTDPYTYDTITASLNVLPGSHTFGVVLSAADGFVLSEDQESQTLNGGANTPATFYLKGVVDSAFWCDAACDGGTGPANADGSYTLAVFGTDHEGDAIPYQTVAPSTIIPVDNGTLSLVETDSDAIVAITSTPVAPLTNPGNANVVTYTEAGQATILSGWTANVKCVKVGTTTVALQVGSSAVGGVSGFNYSANIDPSKDPVNGASPIYNPFTTPTTRVYTDASQDVGTVPVQQDFGNELKVSCDASLGITFM